MAYIYAVINGNNGDVVAIYADDHAGLLAANRVADKSNRTIDEHDRPYYVERRRA